MTFHFHYSDSFVKCVFEFGHGKKKNATAPNKGEHRGERENWNDSFRGSRDLMEI